MCGIWDPDTESYKYHVPCSQNAIQQQVIPPPRAAPQDAMLLLNAFKTNATDILLCQKVSSPTSLKSNSTKQMRCKSYRGLDHVRKTSNKCKFYKTGHKSNVKDEDKPKQSSLVTSVVHRISNSNN